MISVYLGDNMVDLISLVHVYRHLVAQKGVLSYRGILSSPRFHSSEVLTFLDQKEPS